MKFKEYLGQLKDVYYDVSLKFVKSRSCMVWLLLTITSTMLLLFDYADFNGWSIFAGTITGLAIGANKLEQKILGSGK